MVCFNKYSNYLFIYSVVLCPRTWVLVILEDYLQLLDREDLVTYLLIQLTDVNLEFFDITNRTWIFLPFQELQLVVLLFVMNINKYKTAKWIIINSIKWKNNININLKGGEGPEGYHTIGSNRGGTRVPAIDTQRPYGMTQKCFEKWEGPAIRRWGQGGSKEVCRKGHWNTKNSMVY